MTVLIERRSSDRRTPRRPAREPVRRIPHPTFVERHVRFGVVTLTRAPEGSR
jgi:hypothetical protein